MLEGNAFKIVAGHDLVAALRAEKKSRVPHTGAGYASEQLCDWQREISRRGIIGVEIVKSIHGHSVRYDSGLQNFGLVASSRDVGGTYEGAVKFAQEWVARAPEQRYAWVRE